MNDIVTEQTYPVESVWIIKSALGSIFAVVIFTLFLGVSDGRAIAYVIIYLVFIPISLIVTYLQRRNFHYALENQYLTLKQGVLSKQQRHIPYGVIQNVFVKQDLFDRLFGLASLTLENAAQGGGNQQAEKFFGMTVKVNKRQQGETVGFSGNKVSIPGLSKQNAETLKTIVLQKMKENPLEDNQSGL